MLYSSFLGFLLAISQPSEAAIRHPIETTGKVSWYGPGFHGRKTANGERFNQWAMTAAHKTLPFNTRVRVTNLQTKQSVVVRINDRGPYVKGRVLDLSKGAASKIHLAGVGKMQIEIIR